MDIMTVGGVAIDHLFKVTRLPQPHFEGEIIQSSIGFGGRAANVAAMCARLGLKVGIVAPVGNEFATTGYEKHLKGLGVDLSNLKYYPEDSTQTYIFTDPKGQQITFFNKGVCEQFKTMKVPSKALLESKIIHITTSNEPSFNLKTAEFCHENDLPVSFDPGNDPSIEIPEYLLRMITLTECLFLNTEELENILKRLKVENVKELHRFGPSKIIVIDKAERSSIIFHEEKTITVKAVKTEVVDPTGASDAYIAGFLAGRIKALSLLECGWLGATLSSFIMESEGCQTMLPTWRQLEKRLHDVLLSRKKGFK